MRKITLNFVGQVSLNVEDGESVEDVFAELDLIHPDNTRVVDFQIDSLEIIDSK